MKTMTTIQETFDNMNLSTGFLDEFLEHAEILELQKKHFFLKEGEVCQYIGIVLTGNLIAYFETENSDIIVNELYTAQTFLSSYSSFLKQEPATVSIQAVSDVKIYVISHQKYMSLQSSLNWLQFFKHISDRLFLRKCAKETALIKYAANERYKQFVSGNPGIEQHFPQYIIASYLKIRPETLSRMKRLDLHQQRF